MRITLLLIFILTAGIDVSAGKEQKRAEQVLTEVWNEVSKRHFDKDFKEKYQKLYKKFEPAVLKCRNDVELTREINKLLRALGQSHIVLLPPVGVNFSRAMSAIRRNLTPGKKRRYHARSNPPRIYRRIPELPYRKALIRFALSGSGNIRLPRKPGSRWGT